MAELIFEHTPVLVYQRLPAEPVRYNLDSIHRAQTTLIVDVKEEKIGNQLREVEGGHTLGRQLLPVKGP